MLERFDHDEIRVWIEQGESIHLKAISPCGDPVELNALEARSLAQLLFMLADVIQKSS